MAASWRGAWRSRVASSTGKQEESGGGNPAPVQPTTSHQLNQRPPRQDLVAGYYYNCGMSISTTSGTASLSTIAYTTSSSAAASASFPVREGPPPLMLCAAPPPPVVQIDDDDPLLAQGLGGGVTGQDKAKTREHIKDLVEKFHGSDDDASSSNATTAMDKWLSELRVSWVLHLAGLADASARRNFIARRLQYTAHSWVLALHLITRSIVSFCGWCCSQEEEIIQAAADALSFWPPASEFVGFVAATFLQILPFVDIVVALDITIDPSSSDDHTITVSANVGSAVAVAPAHKFLTLADVRDALSGASEQMHLWDLWLRSSSSAEDAEATRISGEMCSLLVQKLDMLDEAIRDTRDFIRTQSMSLTQEDNEPLSGLDQASPDIHKVTRSVISYIIVLSKANYDRPSVPVMDPPIIHEAYQQDGDVPAAVSDENNGSSIHLIMLMMHSLEKKLITVSQSAFPDKSLRFLFLINNFYFVWHQLRTNRLLDAPMQALPRKIDGYINRYLRVSWTPVLKPLHDHTTLCCFMRYSSLHKFEAKFDKTYAAQKLWKVPDPELREELRTAIVDKVISAFTKFLDDNGIRSSSSLKVTPEKLEEMLEELFEG